MNDLNETYWLYLDAAADSIAIPLQDRLYEQRQLLAIELGEEPPIPLD